MTDSISTCFVCGGAFQKELDVKDHFLTQRIEIQCCALRSAKLADTFPEEIGRYYETEDFLSHGDAQKGIFAWLYRQAQEQSEQEGPFIKSTLSQSPKICLTTAAALVILLITVKSLDMLCAEWSRAPMP